MLWYVRILEHYFQKDLLLLGLAEAVRILETLQLFGYEPDLDLLERVSPAQRSQDVEVVAQRLRSLTGDALYQAALGTERVLLQPFMQSPIFRVKPDRLPLALVLASHPFISP
jgi:hypothetical protein